MAVEHGHRTFQMVSFDVQPAFERRVDVLTRLTVGERTDWRWARVEPPLQVGPREGTPAVLDLQIVAIAPRHDGSTWEAGEWPMHVYVCRVVDPRKAEAQSLVADDLSIEYWATLAPLHDEDPR